MILLDAAGEDLDANKYELEYTKYVDMWHPKKNRPRRTCTYKKQTSMKMLIYKDSLTQIQIPDPYDLSVVIQLEEQDSSEKCDLILEVGHDRIAKAGCLNIKLRVKDEHLLLHILPGSFKKDATHITVIVGCTSK